MDGRHHESGTGVLFGVQITEGSKVGSVCIIHNYSGNMRGGSDERGSPQYPLQGNQHSLDRQ